MDRSPPPSLVTATLLAALLAGCAGGGSGGDEWAQCADVRADPDAAIAACTRAYGGARASGSGGWVMRPDARQAYALANRGTAHVVKREYDAAVADLEQAARLDGSQAWVRYNLGLAYAAKGDLGRARASLREALRINPRHEQAAARLAQVEAAMGGGRGGDPQELPKVRAVSVPPP